MNIESILRKQDKFESELQTERIKNSITFSHLMNVYEMLTWLGESEDYQEGGKYYECWERGRFMIKDAGEFIKKEKENFNVSWHIPK